MTPDKTSHKRAFTFIGFFLTVFIVLIVSGIKSIDFPSLGAAGKLTISDQLREERDAAKYRYEIAVIEDKEHSIPIWRTIKYTCYSLLFVSGSIVALSIGFSYSRRLSVFIFKFAEAEIPVRYKDLENVSPGSAKDMAIAAKIEAKSPEKAMEIYSLVAENSVQQLRALSTGRIRELNHIRHDNLEAITEGVIDIEHATPPFSELVQSGVISPGHPLCFGYSKNEPQYRSVNDLKSMAIAGWQGSGKTLSFAYIASSLLLQYPDSVGYVVDPHKNHHEGLGYILKPLEATGRLMIINPFDLPHLMRALNAVLDARLSGLIPSEPLVFVLFDEMNRIGKSASFSDYVVPFAERCTEETRKANVVAFFGCHKWQAKFFKNSAAFRQSIQSYLVHKSKPSQADFLMENASASERKLIKELKNPGDALLATSCDMDPSKVSMPLITEHDILATAETLKQANGPTLTCNTVLKTAYNAVAKTASCNTETPRNDSRNSTSVPEVLQETLQHETPAIMPVPDVSLGKEAELQQLVEQYLQTGGITGNELARRAKINRSAVSRLRNSGAASDKTKQSLLDLIAPPETGADVIVLSDHRKN